MKDIREYKFDKEDLEEIIDFFIMFSRHDEFNFGYDDMYYGVDYTTDGKIWVYEDIENGKSYYFNTPENFFDEFLLDGKPFIESYFGSDDDDM